MSAEAANIRPGHSGDDARTLVERAYQRLRQDIIDGVHAPDVKLRVEHLKDRYGVGAGTLREALALVVSDALVIVHPQRGYRVAPISLLDFQDLTNVRVLVETEALRQSIRKGNDAWESEVVAAFHRLSRAEERLVSDPVGTAGEWESRNRLFHEKLIEACESRWLRHFAALLYQQAERYRRLILLKPAIPRNVHKEHTAIFEATMSRDAEKASRLLAEHILFSLKEMQALLTTRKEPPPKPVRSPRRSSSGSA